MRETDCESHLPKAAHPTAKAFFDALDSRKSSSKQSTDLQRRSQSLGWRNRYSQEGNYPVSMLLDPIQFTVKQVQRGEVEGTYGTGATVWPAAMVLLKYIERHPSLIKGKRVVDLGSGTGITSLAAAVLGASHVVCTDGEDLVVQLAKDNCINAIPQIPRSAMDSITNPRSIKISQCETKIQKYWWGKDPVPDDKCEVILVADCVLPKLYPIAPLVQAIDELLPTKNPDAVAILSYEHRYYPHYDPREKFGELAMKRGLQVVKVDPDQLDPIYRLDDVEIWHVTRKH